MNVIGRLSRSMYNLRASCDLPQHQDIGSYDFPHSLLLRHLRSGLFGSLGKALKQAGIRSILEVGYGPNARYLQYLEQQLPEEIEITGVDPLRSSWPSKRTIMLQGEAADLPEIIGSNRFDLVISHGVFSPRKTFYSDKYGYEENRWLAMRGIMSSLSSHPKAAALVTAFSIDRLAMTRQEFSTCGRILDWRPTKYDPENGMGIVIESAV
ncbi:MAG: hypothetical protein ABIE84_01580 [bacterium]